MENPGQRCSALGPVLGALASGVLIALAQPRFGLWPLAFVCLIPLLRGFEGASLRRRLGLAWLAGTVSSSITGAVSVTVGVAAYFGLPIWQAALVSVATGQLFGAMLFVFFAWLCGDPSRTHPMVSPLRVGAAWMAGELIRSFLFSGLPWMLLAYSVTPVPLLARSASLAGALFVSGWLAALNSSLLTAATAGRRRNSVAFTASLVAALAAQAGLSGAGAAGPGSIRVVGERAAGRGQGVRTLLVQGNLANADRRDPAAALRGLRSLVALSTAEPDVDLAIWPENAVSAILPFNEGLLQQVTDGAGPFPRNLLVGAPRADPANPARIQTSAVLLDSERRAVDHHDKVQLLPFAEVVPWPFSALGRGRIQPVPGARPRVLEADAAKLGPLICYEVLFPKISRSLVRDGAGVLVNLSNDSWFGTTAGLEQHLAAAVLRAIEFRRPLLRATSSGITAAIDAGGRVVARLPVGNAGTLRVDVTPGEGLTPYARSGDAVAWAALLVTAFLALRESAGRHDRGSAEPPVAKPGVPSR